MFALVVAVALRIAVGAPVAGQTTKPPVRDINMPDRPSVVTADLARPTLAVSPTDPGDPATLLSYLKGTRKVFVRYPVHVAILTKRFVNLKVGATPLESRTLIAEHVVDELNEKFRLENGNKIFTFFLERVSGLPRFSTIDSTCQELQDLADAKNPIAGSYFYEARVWADAIAECETLMNTKALNVIIYDAHDASGDATSISSRGNSNKRNGYRSYILLDYERIYDDFRGQGVQEVVVHESGHAFGLGHVCDLSGTSPTNIMTSANNIDEVSKFGTFAGEISYDCPGSGGDRTRGFSPHQLMTILEVSYHHGQNWLDMSPRPTRVP